MTNDNGSISADQTLALFSRKSQRPTSSGPARPKVNSSKPTRIPDMATQEMESALPKLADDNLLGVVAQHVVVRDGDSNLKFRGTLLASAAPESAPSGRWRELRVYQTTGGNKIFSEVGRSLREGERDKFEACAYEPDSRIQGHQSADGTPITEEQTYVQHLTRFFQYSDLAKKLYEKLGVSAETEIN